MICVECSRSVNQTFQEFSKGNIRLVHCDYCKEVVDKYVEYDFVIIFLDLILHRIQVYRHILFNRTEYCDKWIPIPYMKIFVLYVFFEAYIKWSKLKDEFQAQMEARGQCTFEPFEPAPEAQTHYLFILILAVAEYAVYLAGVVFATKLAVSRSRKQYAIVKYNYLVMAIILSSFGKAFVLLMMIWSYTEVFAHFGAIINAFVLTSNVLALRVFLGKCTTTKAVSIIGFGYLLRFCFQLFVAAVIRLVALVS
eukprot:TRINITY_DN927_c0_g1_i1.p2 TRINITY_DN927_c0_g1~~TRINITY_DN927_c0_g1_i1.p2  ORF type:complete len:252 (+),score=63.46 TRINITY_DN927_c0_g1_i1:962-1717(+)